MKKQCKLTRILTMLLAMCILFGCVACAGPVDSPEPTDPTTGTTAPTDPGSPTDPTEPANPTDPSDPSDPTEPTDPSVPDVPVVNPDADPEKIFTNTIHDFDGYRVENLDDREDTNFVVYAKGVQELTSTAGSNVLQSVNEDTRTYTFKNPDAAMKALKAGDVFYIPVSEHNPEASALKVKTIQFSGYTATIQSDTVTMEDLFVYIDMDVYLDPTQVYQENDDARATRSAAFKSPLEDEKDTTLSDINFGRYVNFALGTGSNGLGSSMELGCDFCGTLRNTRVQLRYSVWNKYFSYDVSTRLILDVHTTLDCSGVIKADKDLPLLKVPLGLTGFAIGLQAVGGVNLSATASGQWDVLYEYDLGASYYPDKGMNTYFTPVSKSNDGELSFEGSFELSVGIKATFGIPEVVNAYIQGDAGWELTGEFAEIEDEGSGADCIHDCEKCIDGDVNFFVRASAGISADILKETLKIDLGLKRDIAEKKWKLGDFYCSFNEGYYLPSFDWKECPFKRWKVEVKVKDEDGNPVNDAEVYYTDSDGTTDYYYTNAQGVATLFVFNGSYTIECIYEGKEYDKEVTVNEAPETVEFLLEDEIPIYYERSIYTDDDVWKSIEPMILSAYPNAIDYEYFDFEASEAFKIYVDMYCAHLDSDGNGIITHWRIRLLILSEGHWEEIGWTGRHLMSTSRKLSTSHDSGEELLIEYQVRDFERYGNYRTVDEKMYVSDTRAYNYYYDFSELRNECEKSFESRLLSDFESELRRLSVEMDRIIEEVYK